MRTPLTDEQKQTGVVKEYIEVSQLFEENEERLKLKVLAGKAGLGRRITNRELHRPGLALTGFLKLFTYDRVQVLGNTEIHYLISLTKEALSKSLEEILNHEIPCFVITNDSPIPETLSKFAEKAKIPILGSELTTTDFYHFMSDYLDGIFSPHITIHGSLVDVYGTGMLITGRSGIGKSEIALDLVERGHRLVADDSVHLERKSEGVIIGRGPEMIRHFIEIRGLGMVDVRQMFGVRAIRIQKRVEVEVRLMEWDEDEEWERIGLDTMYTKYLGVDIPVIKLPIFPGKNITMIAEVIALNTHLKIYGYNAAEELNRRVLNSVKSDHIKRYLHKDFE